jgi:hypothetical protein
MHEVELRQFAKESEHARLHDWRRQVLADAGYPLPLAAELACSTADLHTAVELIDRGCPADVAAAILL